MADLSSFEIDPTLAAMHEAVEKAAMLEKPRDYVGASGLGHICERSLWYQFNNYPAKPIEAKGLFAIQDGHNTEALIIERLKMVSGLEIWTRDESGKQHGFSKYDGKFRGNYDGIILGLLQSPKTPHILEIKTCNEKKFNELQKCKDKHGEKSALEAWDYQFYIQAQCYMGAEELTRHYLVCATPGGRAVMSCRTEFNRSVYEAMDAKALRIINAKTAPKRHTTMKSHYVCKWCRYSDVCWKDNA